MVIKTNINNTKGINQQNPNKPQIDKLNKMLSSSCLLTEHEQLRLLAAAVHSAQDSIVITTTQLDYPGPEIIFVNRAFTKMTGYESEEIIGKTPRILQGAKTDRLVFQELKESLRNGKVFYGQAINYRKDGTEFWNQWHIEGIKNEHNQVTHYLAIQRDVTKEKEIEAQLIYDASHDMLTSLNNRAWFMKKLQKSIDKSQENQDYLFALLFLDLDGFKQINDTLGHPAGDRFLQEIALRLKKTIRSEDRLARLGGDEFTIIVENIQDLSIVSNIAERIQTQLKLPFILDNHQVVSAGTIGIALSNLGYNNADDMLRDADLAMYRAKSLGKSRSIIFNPTMHHVALEKLNLENDLRKALENKELELYYQPIIELKTKQIAGFEALLRWQHPQKGMISPVKFIPLAEDIGLIIPIGEWVIRQACLKAAMLQIVVPNNSLFMTINLSPKQFAQSDLLSKIKEILDQTDCDRHLIKFELTESAILEDEDQAISLLNDLKDLGVKLCIDDFGTGYSSLNRLCTLPINTIKIDRCFVDAIGKNKREKILETIISLAHNLDMNVVAEGVETELHLEKLAQLNCEFVQGYLFSRPMNNDNIDKLFSVQQN